ncbi:NAD(P)-dependent oxidoreductase [Aquiflexum sp. LQ15W]|uniref:NAD(P)-dependent oxidoreductase n=1 Tax=Cognataquiflexum nitidum TaxID=2922272 RepID=UPI001F12EB15|nr:NAD(P)-dependent oxidoreductase [Cognataquiflexum nitidum]MCH6199005.1 NAD(P)-dependent oxidoreductase [Cognataquiflexum nitidum]
MKIGLIKEGKVPTDRRVPFTPKQLSHLSELYKDTLSFYVESSPFRCFSDEEYIQEGIEVVGDISFCDLLMGVKEVPVAQLISDKTYIFFSHTIKEQVHNRKLLQTVLEKNITLMDYEVLKDENGNRTVAFGHWAGIVGAYNGLWAYGKKSGLFDLKRAMDCFDKEELQQELGKVQLPPIKIVVTGTGRVGKGVVEILQLVGIRQVGAKELLQHYFDEPVFSVLSTEEYYRRKTDGGYERQEFYSSPDKYESHFLKFAEVSDILMAASYWDPRAPKLFEMEDIRSEEFSISVVADITCDINGSIPTTLKPSSILDPIYDIDRDTFEVLPAFGKQTSISVMAIDNLPTELPRNASEDFGKQLMQHLIPELLKGQSRILDQATIAKEGDLTIEFIFLKQYINTPQE